jgi:hypothetical protein
MEECKCSVQQGWATMEKAQHSPFGVGNKTSHNIP